MPKRWVSACIAGLLLFAPRRLRHKRRCRPSALARDCGPASCTRRPTAATTPTSSCSTARASTSTVRSPRRSSSCSTPSTTAHRTRSACWTRSRDSRCRRSSTSGWAGSCRRATAPTSTARTTRTTGRVYTDGIQNGHPFVFQGRDNGVDVLGRFRQGEGLGRRVRRPVGDRQPRRARRRRASRSISGTRKTATT